MTYEKCPFCGNANQKQLSLADGERVVCDVCNAIGPLGENPDEAIELWNKRED